MMQGKMVRLEALGCGRGWRLEPRKTERKVCEGRPRINKRLGVGHDERVIAALGTPIPSSYDLLMRPCALHQRLKRLS